MTTNNPMVKAVFFDIDGTLVSFRTHTMPESARLALTALRQNGVKVFVATGRAPSSAEFIKEYFDFDGFVYFNGALCLDKDGKILHDEPLNRAAVDGAIPYMNENKIACCFEMADRTVFNLINDRVRDLMKLVDESSIPSSVEDVSQTADSVYQLSAFVTESEEADFMSRLPDCKALRWHPLFVNVVGKNGGKPVGIAKICEQYGFDLKDVMAFGDGGNDSDMLKSVGLGVAMGNAGDAVKQIADYVTTDVDDNGVFNALKRFEVI